MQFSYMILEAILFSFGLLIALLYYIMLRFMKDILNREKYKIEYWTYDKDLYPDLNKNFKYDSSSCFDIKTTETQVVVEPGDSYTFKTGLFFNLPLNFELQIRPRSGLSKSMIYTAFGTVDGDYRGEVGITVYNFSKTPLLVNKGDRIAQAHISKVEFSPRYGDRLIMLESKDDLDKTSRGESGFGSTGV